MNFFGYLKTVLPGRRRTYSRYLNDSTPLYSFCGNNIYLSDFVNNAIDRVASEVSKINIKSIVQSGDSLSTQNDDITRLFKYGPNPLQTTSDFISCVEWIRRKNRNAFIYPQYEIVAAPDGRQFKKYVAFWPLNPQTIEIGVGDAGQAWEIHMYFSDGSDYSIPYADLIHMKWRRGMNTVVGGGDDNGRPEDKDLVQVLSALNKTIDGLPKAIEASLQVKGVYHAKTGMDAAKLEKQRNDFESHIFSSKAGMVATDLAGEFTPINIDAPNIPDAAMKFLKAVIQERYGVSAAILSGDYNGEQHSAFYQTALEDFIVQFEQEFTRRCFTQREQDVGHCIRCYYSKISYMDATAKNNLAILATNTGLMALNQIADMYGMEPFEGGNVRVRSLNYIDASIANQYQLKELGDKNVKEPAS